MADGLSRPLQDEALPPPRIAAVEVASVKLRTLFSGFQREKIEQKQ